MRILKENFIANYNKNKAPFGVYLHPAWFYNTKGEPDPLAIKLLSEFFTFLKGYPNVVFENYSGIINWVKNP